MENKSEHLPLFGVGPIIVYGQFILTAVSIILTMIFDIKIRIDWLQIPFIIVGIIFIVFGFYLDLSAKLKSKLFENVKENKLITDGVYSVTRNPVYSGSFLICLGAIFVANNLLLFMVPIICWVYMTIFLINTEENGLEICMEKNTWITVKGLIVAFLGSQSRGK